LLTGILLTLCGRQVFCHQWHIDQALSGYKIYLQMNDKIIELFNFVLQK
jgi:hypothetical protein